MGTGPGLESRIAFKILGPLSIIGRSRATIKAPKQRALLATLLLNANRSVSAEVLAEILWEGDRPADVRAALHVHVTRLRRQLADIGADGIIETGPGGYSIKVSTEALDLSWFRSLLLRARQVRRDHDLDAESALLAEALSLWHGTALSDVSASALHRDYVPQLTEEHMDALERRFDVELLKGRHDEIVGELMETARRNQLRERLWAQLMLALYRCGRQAEALAAYRSVASSLRTDLGLDPSKMLTSLNNAILVGSPELAAGGLDTLGEMSPRTEPSALSPASDTGWNVLCQLPADASVFVGRDETLAEVGELLSGRTGPSLRAAVISGPPGVGKSTLAVHIAHRLREEYPDGQWFARFTDTRGSKKGAVAVLTELLRASGVAPDRIPRDPDNLERAFRAHLSDRRVLLLLDDVEDLSQVTPLLPGTPGSAVIVTGRVDMTQLVALYGAHSITLGVLSQTESRALLERMIGRPLSAAEVTAADRLSLLCGYLPLALRVAAANVAHRPGGLVDYVDELAKGDRLGQLFVGEGQTVTLRAAFDVSYEALPPSAQRLFQLLGVAPVADFSHDLVTALAGDMAPATADRRLPLHRLIAAHLLEEHTPGRFRLHDLLRLYAEERAEDQIELDSVLSRLFSWYLRRAHAAMDVFRPGLVRLPVPPALAEGAASGFGTAGDALIWLDSERRNIISLIDYAADHGRTSVAWHLADAIRGYLWAGHHYHDWLAAAGTGLLAATREDDLAGMSAMHYSLGLAHRSLGGHREADSHLRKALTGFQEADQFDYEVAALSEVGIACQAIGALDEAQALLRRSRDRAKELRLWHGAARALRGLGSLHHARGQLSVALRDFGEALAIDRAAGVSHAEPENLRRIALVQADLGVLHEAREQLIDALSRNDQAGDRRERSTLLTGLSVVSRRSDQPTAAVNYAQRSVATAREIGDPVAEAEALVALAGAYAASDRLDLAKSHFDWALGAARGVEALGTELQALIGLSRISLAEGRPDEAEDLAREALAGALRSGLRPLEGMARAALAAALHRLESTTTAKAQAELAALIIEQTGPRAELATVLQLLDSIRAPIPPQHAPLPIQRTMRGADGRGHVQQIHGRGQSVRRAAGPDLPTAELADTTTGRGGDCR